MPKKSTYQIMTSILNNYNPTNDEKLSINSFFMVRWLSNNNKAIHIGNVFNRFYKEMPLSVQYNVAKQLLKGKIKFIQFPKKEKNIDVIIINISKFYKINLEKAHDYYDLMPDSERQKFKNLYNGA